MKRLKSPFVQYILLIIIIIAFLFPFASVNAEDADVELLSDEITHVFFSRGCLDCWPYVEDDLLPALQAHGLASDYVIYDYTVPSNRTLLSEMMEQVSLPRSIADSLYAFVPTPQGTLILLGHIPSTLLTELATSPSLPPRLVVWQPVMHGTPTEYRLWAWSGSVQSFSIETPLAISLPQAIDADGPLPAGMTETTENNTSWHSIAGLLPIVVTTGLLDSVNPCAFAVILLLLAFLFTLRRSRGQILKLGLVYIAMIFLVYFTIGIGLFQAVRISEDPHFVARIGSWILITLGGINLLEYFFPNFPIKLHMPKSVGDRTNQLIKKSSLPATMAAGFLVGLCTFPCSGGIYVSIITMLNAKTTMGWGLAYLGLYNILFVLPLIGILLAAGNRTTVKAWARWERRNAINIRLWYGIAMVTLGIVMMLWVI